MFRCEFCFLFVKKKNSFFENRFSFLVFRLSFKKMQALAFLPINDVPKGFEILSQGKYIKKLQIELYVIRIYFIL